MGSQLLGTFVLSLTLVASATLADEAVSQGTPVSVFDFKVKTIDGKEVSLAEYKGKTLLIVNTASHCGFTPQYAGLEALYQKYKDKGLVVLAFPSNNFLGQEPGSNEEIKQFCELKYKTTFPLFEKIDVKGKSQAPLYKYLTGLPGKQGGSISWNFNKFLVAPDGTVVEHFGSKIDPTGSTLTQKVEEVLPKS